MRDRMPSVDASDVVTGYAVSGTSHGSVACAALVRVEDGAYSHVVLPAMLRRSRL